MRRKTALSAAIDTVNCAITIKGNRAFMSGDYPLEFVREVTSYFVEGYNFAPAYNKRIYDKLLGKWRRAWDGRSHLFEINTRSMPSGLARLVERELRAASPTARVMVTDERGYGPPIAGGDDNMFQLVGIDFGAGKFDYQLEAAKAAIKRGQCILKVATNGGKTEIAAAVAKYLRVHTLFVVPGVDLLHQTRERFAKRLGLQLSDVGIVGDGENQIGQWVTIATVDSLHARMNDDEEMKKWLQERVQLVFVDECHTAGSDTFYDVLDAVSAFYRIGLSGTPLDRSDGADLRLIAQTGEIAYEVSNKLLIERGVSVPVEVEIKRVDTPKVVGGNYKSVQKQAIVTNTTLNNDIVKWVPQQLEEGEQVLILVNTIEHGKALEAALQAVRGTDVKFLHGSEPTQVRRDTLAGFTAGTVRCIIGTSIMRTGIDTPAIDIIVFADIGKSKIAALQAIGRGLRSRPGKTRLLVRDYANFCHKWLTNHSLKRLQIYKKEQCFQLRVAV
jgi:superfamily II DNA or RNA helicase